MVRPAIQLYTLREIDEPVPALIDRVGETDLEGVEFAGLGDADPEDVAAALDANDVEAPSAHVPLADLSDDFDATVAAYREVGCETLVVPAVDPERFADADAVDSFAAELDDLADRLADRDLQLGYHNHRFEFADLGEETAMDRLVAKTDAVAIEFDVGLATHAGADPVRFLRAHADRIPLVHFTDTIPGDADAHHVNYGEGQVDLEACGRVAAEIGAEWGIYEHGLTDDPTGALDEAERELPLLLSTH